METKHKVIMIDDKDYRRLRQMYPLEYKGKSESKWFKRIVKSIGDEGK